MSNGKVLRHPTDHLFYWYAACGAGGKYSRSNPGGDYGTAKPEDARIKLRIHENGCKKC